MLVHSLAWPGTVPVCGVLRPACFFASSQPSAPAGFWPAVSGRTVSWRRGTARSWMRVTSWTSPGNRMLLPREMPQWRIQMSRRTSRTSRSRTSWKNRRRPPRATRTAAVELAAAGSASRRPVDPAAPRIIFVRLIPGLPSRADPALRNARRAILVGRRLGPRASRAAPQPGPEVRGRVQRMSTDAGGGCVPLPIP